MEQRTQAPPVSREESPHPIRPAKVGWLAPLLWAGALGLALAAGAMLSVAVPPPAEQPVASVAAPVVGPPIHSAADIVDQMEARARIAAEAEREQELEVQSLVDEEAPVEEAISESDQQTIAESFISASVGVPGDVLVAPRREADAAEFERSAESSAELIASSVRAQRADDLQAATTLMRQEEYRAARNVLKDCVAADPKNAECHKLLGNAYARLEQRELAAAEYRQFLKFASEDHPQYSRVEDVLAAYDQKP